MHLLAIESSCDDTSVSVLCDGIPIPALQIRFIKKFNIRYIWFDESYHSEIRQKLSPARLKSVYSKAEKLEFWEIDPSRISL